MNTPDTPTADYVVVGTGSAGAALAARLSEDASSSVAVLEETIAVLSDATALRALGEADAELARGEGAIAHAARHLLRALQN